MTWLVDQLHNNVHARKLGKLTNTMDSIKT